MFCTWQDSDQDYRLDSTMWAEGTQRDPANGTGSAGGIITMLKFYRNKTGSGRVCLFYQFTLARVAELPEGRARPHEVQRLRAPASI